MTDSLLKVGRYIGLLGFLGGLAALAAMWCFGPPPQDATQWDMLLALTRMVFYRCMFAGILVLAVVGSISWWRHRRLFNRQRWFRLMMVLLVVAIPALHLWARITMLKIKDVIEEGNLTAAESLWSQMGTAYFVSLIALMIIAGIGIIKPRL